MPNRLVASSSMGLGVSGRSFARRLPEADTSPANVPATSDVLYAGLGTPSQDGTLPPSITGITSGEAVAFPSITGSINVAASIPNFPWNGPAGSSIDQNGNFMGDHLSATRLLGCGPTRTVFSPASSPNAARSSHRRAKATNRS